jgi:hypothetical protein
MRKRAVHKIIILCLAWRYDSERDTTGISSLISGFEAEGATKRLHGALRYSQFLTKRRFIC